MSAELEIIPEPITGLKISQLYPDLPVEDGEPLESNPHRMAMTALIQSLKYAWAERQDFFIGGNMFVYFSPNQVLTDDYRGPDFFVVLDTIRNDYRNAWKIWKEGGRKPNMVVELLSKTTKNFDLNQKKTIYEQKLQTEDYFVFDPLEPDYLRGWHLDKGHYQELHPNKNGWLWVNSLSLWLGTWKGTIESALEPGIWLRFYDMDGTLLPLPEEEVIQIQQERNWALQQAQQEQQRSKKLAELLRAQGVNIDEIDL